MKVAITLIWYERSEFYSDMKTRPVIPTIYCAQNNISHYVHDHFIPSIEIFVRGIIEFIELPTQTLQQHF